ncbi:MAG: hypothetical protein F6K22_06830 [Okeania sp. SIO2F4]|uniref:glycosyltransferase family 39 protein n=1 Tax=Okeania sp. SIO2F4 TaxID=2607790 RepID=UPI00142A3DB9|nr:glycosyltransferase family 39 protein [Okeania sp. SIO2F4]NES02581.1 hypothetical protein [Okeania sp. SIO2F4]
MSTKLERKSSLQANWLQFTFVMILVLGIFLRFVNLDKKVYWTDETLTSLRISGYTGVEVVDQLFDGRKINVEELQKYQRINPEVSFTETVKNLAIGNPHHPPLFYIMERFWVQWFGSSVTVTRSLSAILSLLVFPSVYWLCRELFQKPIFGWVAIAIFAISPFHILYAQEARQYSLWTATILLSSAALLRALRINDRKSWAIYTASTIFNLYTFLFSILVVVAHGIYVGIIEGLRVTNKVKAFIVSCLLIMLGFFPWLIVVVGQLNKINKATDWSAIPVGYSFLIKAWILHLVRLFFDIEFSWKNPLTYLSIPILVLVVYSIYFLCRKTPQKTWLFILTLICISFLPIVLADLFFGGRRSSISRYLVPYFIGIQLAVSYLLGVIIGNLSESLQQRKVWQIITVSIISLGIFSSVIISQAEVWWNKYTSVHHPYIADIVNRDIEPILVNFRGSLGYALSLSYLLDSKVQLRLYRNPDANYLPDESKNVFLLYPSRSLLKKLEQEEKYKIQLVYKPAKLWKLENN